MQLHTRLCDAGKVGYWEDILFCPTALISLTENLMCLHSSEMPQIKIYFGMMSLTYGLMVGSALENSRSVFEFV